MNSQSRVYVAGNTGLVGSAIIRMLQRKGYVNISLSPSSDFDLRQQEDVERFFRDNEPEYVYLAAAKVGGILANRDFPAHFIYDNLMIQSNIIHAARKFGVKKLLFLGKFDEGKDVIDHDLGGPFNPSISLWGDGTPKREFLHVDDLAEACFTAMVNYDSDEPLNVGTGEDIEIGALARMISDVVGFNGGIIWDTDKPNGTPRKVLDVTKIKSLGWEPKIKLKDGIKETYDWYKQILMEKN